MNPWTADEALASRCLAGDERAWRDLVSRHSPRVYSLCLLSGLRTADAEDVTQEVLVSAFRSLSRFGGCQLSTWLHRLTRRRVADHFRSPARRSVPSGLPGDADFPAAAVSVDGPERALFEGEEHRRVRHALLGLGEPARSILMAYYVAEVPVRDIARDFDMPESTVKSHLRRGRLTMRQRLGEPT